MAASRFGASRSAAGKAGKNAAAKAPSKAAEEKKPGRFKTVWQIYTLTRESDRLLPLWMALAFAGSVLVVLLFGLLVHAWLPIVLVFGVVLGLMVALIVMSRRAQRFAYERAAGQPGVSGQVMKNIRRGSWYVEDEPVAVDPRTRDLVFRAVGRPGVVLAVEGPVGRTERLVEGERKRVARVVGPNVPVTVLHVGDGDGQVPLRRLETKMTRMRPALSKGEVSAVAARLKALGGARPPIPKGIDPTRMRPDRKGVRGR
jgi:Domain of unknown function (DUF4191)